MDLVSPGELKALLLTEEELAVVDIREQGRFSESHLLYAVCVPLSRLELLIGDLVPRKTTPVVVVGESSDDEWVTRGVGRLIELGYEKVGALDGGVQGWADAGFELFSGVNVPSKAFGEFVEHTYDTPRLAAAEVKAMLDAGRDMVIVDSRPFEEFHRMNIPTAMDMPGAELVYRIHDIAPDPDTFVVVNCAGRTRSIIGTQSLINAGIPNQVAALKDGTMGWHLAGYELEHGTDRVAEAPGESGREKALAAAARVAERFGVKTVSADDAERWAGDAERTTFLLDVRSPEEFRTGHLAGYRNAPGGQLVQATDEYVGVKNSRLVLADDIGVRATMTASWLVQLGWNDVYVLERGIETGPLEAGDRPATILGELGEAAITASELAEGLSGIAVLDLGPSVGFERAHIPGAWWSVRSRLREAIAAIGPAQRIVLTSPDGTLARLALAAARAVAPCPVDAVRGGTAGWVAGGHQTEAGLDRTVGATDDVWFKPYEHRDAQEKFMREYLTWEVALVEQIERDGTARFLAF